MINIFMPDYLKPFETGGATFPALTLPSLISTTPTTPVATTSGAITGDSSAITKANDTRVRLRPITNTEEQIYGSKANSDNILKILYDTRGVLFPYTPTIAVNQSVDYKDVILSHTNGDYSAYNHTPSVTISVTGKFTVQNQREGKYALAVLHFLRTVSKMYFGEKDAENGLAGLPPPVLIFEGYGNYMFNNLPVILKSHSYSLDDNVDQVEISTASGLARLPSMFTIQMDLQVQQTPKAMRKEFSLDEFRTGALMRGSGNTGWI